MTTQVLNIYLFADLQKWNKIWKNDNKSLIFLFIVNKTSVSLLNSLKSLISSWQNICKISFTVSVFEKDLFNKYYTVVYRQLSIQV